MKWEIPFFSPNIGPPELLAVQRPIQKQWLTMGDEVRAVEQHIRDTLQVKHVHLVTNCTAALHLSAIAVGLKKDDEVICPTLSFVASANVFKAIGCKVVFCDSIGPDDLNIDPNDIENKITEKTKAIVPVHFAGFPCKMKKIQEIARTCNLSIVEDCAHAAFTVHDGAYLGTFGDVGCFSFFSNKNVTCGEGGAVITNDDTISEKLRLMRSHGMTSLTLDRYKGRATSYDVLMPGFNYRMDELRAALLSAQIKQLPSFLDKRRKLFLNYKDLLSDTPIELPFSEFPLQRDWDDTAVHILVVLLPENTERTEVIAKMNEQKIQTSIHYPPIHTFTAFQNGEHEVDKTERLSARLLSLPFYPDLTRKQCETVVGALLKSIQNP